MPFFIDWLNSPHPADGAASGVALVELVTETPDAREVARMYEALGVDVAVKAGAERKLVAELEGRMGRVVLT